MPNRERNGAVIKPARVVAPISVKSPQVQTMRARARSLADDDVELVILHRRIEDFFDVGLKPVNLVDEQHVAKFEIRQNGGEIAFELDQRAGGGAEIARPFHWR